MRLLTEREQFARDWLVDAATTVAERIPRSDEAPSVAFWAAVLELAKAHNEWLRAQIAAMGGTPSLNVIKGEKT